MIVIKGGMTYTENGFAPADVIVEDSDIAVVGQAGETTGARVIDASGCLVGPGFVDVHVHLREPGQTWKEDIGTGSRAAAAGGYTAIVAMPNTEPATDSVKLVEEVRARGREVGLVEVATAAAMTGGRAGIAPADLEGLYGAGVRIFSDDGDCVLDGDVLLAIMERLSRCPGAVISQHAEDAAATAGGHMHQGELSARLGIGGLPADAETSIVERDLGLVRRTGAAYHCQHVSARGTVDIVRRAKDGGLPVTAEVTPHHLTFEVSSVAGLDPNLKMYPPIRTREDRTALREALNDGTIDIVATDHAPHTGEEKEAGFAEAPRGVIGLETAAAAVSEVVTDPARLFEVMSVAPALLADLERQGRPLAVGEPANIVVFDPEDTWVPTSFASRSFNSPYRGRRMQGRVRATIYEGTVTHLREDDDE